MTSASGTLQSRTGSLLPPVIIEGITTPAKAKPNAASSSSSSSSSTSTDGKLAVGATTYDSAGTLPVYPSTTSLTAAQQQAGDQSWMHPAAAPAVDVKGRQAGSLTVPTSNAGFGLSYAMPQQQTGLAQAPRTAYQPAAPSLQAQSQHAPQLQQVSAFAPTSRSQAPAPLASAPMNVHASTAAPSNTMFTTQQQLQLAHLQLQSAMMQSNGMLHINTQMPSHLLGQMGAGSLHGMMQPPVPQAGQGMHKLAQGASLLAASDIHTSQRAAQLARYRHKRNNRLQALAMGDKKIRYQCRKTLADARPRVKGRFAKIHTDGLESPTGGSSPKASKAKAQKGKVMKTVMSAMDLASAHGMLHAMPKLEDLDEINAMWWLNDSDDADQKSCSDNSTVPGMGDFSDDVRRCYSENNLLHLDAFDAHSAMEVFQTENNFNAICSGLQGN